jgi:hypothetical protein
MRMQGSFPGEQWEIDFTEIKLGLYGYTYLLVMVDTFSGWTEAFPTKTETAQITVKKLLQEVVPRFGLPLIQGSDNGPAFTAKISKLIGEKSTTDQMKVTLCLKAPEFRARREDEPDSKRTAY